MFLIKQLFRWRLLDMIMRCYLSSHDNSKRAHGIIVNYMSGLTPELGPLFYGYGEC